MMCGGEIGRDKKSGGINRPSSPVLIHAPVCYLYTACDVFIHHCVFREPGHVFSTPFTLCYMS